MESKAKYLILLFAILAIALLVLLSLQPGVQEEYVVVDVEHLPSVYVWQTWKPVVLKFENVSIPKIILCWCTGDGEFSSMGKIEGKTVFVLFLNESFVLQAKGIEQLRIESLERLEPLFLPSLDWKVCGNLPPYFFAMPGLKVNCNVTSGNVYAKASEVLTLVDKNITGYGKDGEIRGKAFDGVLLRSGSAEKFSLRFEEQSLALDGKDRDGDGIWDVAEEEIGLNASNPDCDRDGAGDGVEVYWGTNPLKNDTDGDGLNDGMELLFVPLHTWMFEGKEEVFQIPATALYQLEVSDWVPGLSVSLNGRMLKQEEEGNKAVFKFNASNGAVLRISGHAKALLYAFGINPFCGDADNDGLNDSVEIEFGSSPLLPDTDNDSLNDSLEARLGTKATTNDTDNDGLSDAFEYLHGLNPKAADTDGDGIPDGEEFNYWHSMLDENASAEHCRNPDVDNDSMPDGWEIYNHLKPAESDWNADSDNDGLSNLGEWDFESNPGDNDTDDDGLSDGAEVGNCIYRTNIPEGAKSIRNYNASDGWIWWNWSKFVWSNASAMNASAMLLFSLADGGIYYNTTGREIIVVSGLENGKVNGSHVVYKYAGPWSESGLEKPMPGYKGKEIFEGTNPCLCDTDGDGVYDYDNGIWDSKFDYDADNASDGYEVYTVYRESLESSKEHWIALDLNWSDCQFSLTGFMLNQTVKATKEFSSKAEAEEFLASALASLGNFIGYSWSGKAIYWSDNRASKVVLAGLVEKNNVWLAELEIEHYNQSNEPCIETCQYALGDYASEGKEVHCIIDYDGDGLLDLGDEDSDNDGIKDGDEPLYWLDTDCDGNVNMRDNDSDNDGLLDAQEDLNCNGRIDAWESSPIAKDTDNDGLSDVQEHKRFFTNPSNADTDGDGLSDSLETKPYVWWFSERNFGKEFFMLPYSRYFLLYQANASYVDFEIVGRSAWRVQRKAKPGEWLYEISQFIESPQKINVYNHSIKYLAIVPPETETNWQQSIRISTSQNMTIQINLPEFYMSYSCVQARLNLGFSSYAYAVVYVSLENIPVAYYMKNSTAQEERKIAEVSSIINNAILQNRKSVNLTVNITSTAGASADGSLDIFFFPYFTNPFEADSDNDSLSDAKEQKYFLNAFCNDTDWDGLSDSQEVGAFYESIERNAENWNESHDPGIYFLNWSQNITRRKAEFEFWFEVKAKNLSAHEFPKAVAVNGFLSMNPGAEGEIQSLTASLDWNNTTVCAVAEPINAQESAVHLLHTMESPGERIYHARITWEYGAVGKDWKPDWRISLQFGGSERLTDPLDADSDNDLIVDGNDTEPFEPLPLPESPFEDNDGDGLLNWEEEDAKTDKNKRDTDEDGLTDYDEVKNYHTDGTKRDTDNDGLSDYEEVFKYGTDPNCWSTDSDGLSDGFEILVSNTDPKNPDTDGDHLNDSMEWEYGLNPLSNDTDCDQWDDYKEYNHWYGLINNKTIAAQYCQTPDIDGDGITDYQEVYGYTVMTVRSWIDEKPYTSEWTMYGDPLQAYKQTDGKWTDTDADNIPDIVEIYFSNTTWIDNETLWQKMIVSNGLAGRYGWCREYYHELNASNSSLAENWTQKAFNPFVYNTMPPMVVSYSVTIEEIGNVWDKKAKISFEYHVRDVKGIKKMVVELSDSVFGMLDSRDISFHDDYPTECTYSDSFICELWHVVGTGIRLKGTVENIVSDKVSVEWEHKGLISGVISVIVDGAQALWQMLSGGLQKIWEAVAKAVSMIVEWVKEQINKILEPLIAPVKAAIESFGQAFNQILTESTSIDALLFGLSGLIFGHSPPHVLMLYLQALVCGLFAIEVAFLAITTVLGGGVIVNLITEAVFRGILQQLVFCAAVEIISLFVADLLPLILDITNPVWYNVTSWGLTVLDVVLAVGMFIYAFIKNKIRSYAADIFGLFLSFVGLFLAVSGYASTFLGASIAAIISGIGLMIAIYGEDIQGVWGKVDEVVDALNFGFAAYNAGKAVFGG